MTRGQLSLKCPLVEVLLLWKARSLDPQSLKLQGEETQGPFLGRWSDGRWGPSYFYPLVPDPCIPLPGDTAQYIGHCSRC